MAEIFKFFNSAPGDERWHYASDFADYFGNVLSSGLLHKDGTPNLQVKVNAGTMQTYIEAGEALIQGYQYQNTLPLFLTHGLPEPNLDRIDRIVLRLDKRNNARYIKLFVKEGVSATNPVTPTLQRDQYVFELSLAQIRLTKNTSTLEPLKLVDERMKQDLCGIVYSLISVPTSVFQQQWDYWFNNKKQTLEDDLVAWQVQQKNEFDVWQAEQELEFLTWFESIKDILSGDVAANLATRILELEQTVTNHTSPTATGAHKAKNIEVVDVNNLFTAIDVEGVLKELFTNADSAQKGIANVVGSPAIPSNTLSQLTTHIQNAKNKGATNLTAKGQSSSGTESLDALMSKIANVNTGKKFAQGSITPLNGNNSITTGVMSFRPNTAIAFNVRLSTGQFVVAVYNKVFGISFASYHTYIADNNRTQSINQADETYSGGGFKTNGVRQVAGGYVIDFTLGWISGPDEIAYWIAFE